MFRLRSEVFHDGWQNVVSDNVSAYDVYFEIFHTLYQQNLMYHSNFDTFLQANKLRYEWPKRMIVTYIRTFVGKLIGTFNYYEKMRAYPFAFGKFCEPKTLAWSMVRGLEFDIQIKLMSSE